MEDIVSSSVEIQSVVLLRPALVLRTNVKIHAALVNTKHLDEIGYTSLIAGTSR